MSIPLETVSPAAGGEGDASLDAILAHADDNLILAQQLSGWIAAAPDLELDLALGNIALDHLGVARALLARYGELEGKGRTEDDLAMTRSEREFRNLLICEQPNGDFGQTIARQLLVDCYQVDLWERLSAHSDPVVAGVAAKALLEARYHWRHSSTWAKRLGAGTEESHRRMQLGLDAMTRFVDEMFDDFPDLRPSFDSRLAPVLAGAGLELANSPFPRRGGRHGLHSEHLGHLLADMQWMARSYPGAKW
ncbi:MAG TPA: 1,2-phenylacetyl-CoA epoxidase subunit PaaC [Acidimicrobiia bacterium]|nr:1,2-phenylacetyl-CoA epoxidase subunit PaaC [Acidimicrobiia bacterium]